SQFNSTRKRVHPPDSGFSPISCPGISDVSWWPSLTISGTLPSGFLPFPIRCSWHMLVIPAIDLKDGHCVRLQQGDMNAATVFSDDPAKMARHWQKEGAKRLHLVDLNGAFAGKPVNERAIKAIV